MQVTARLAADEDLDTLLRLYRLLEAEQVALKPMWAKADGLDEPLEASFKHLLGDERSTLIIGSVDDHPLGFLWARPQGLLAQADGEEVGVIRLIFTEFEARGVGVGHEMLTLAMEQLSVQGIRKFDAIVSPGHRNAKNFFEAHGFKARSITMHHEAEDG
jgi:ribosomal protein S18 acetylase RimI-like enzyme